MRQVSLISVGQGTAGRGQVHAQVSLRKIYRCRLNRYLHSTGKVKEAFYRW